MSKRLPSGLPRWFDAIAASTALLFLAPLLLSLALLVKATSRGPALFRQQRVGLNGKPFQLLKFRSMIVAPEPSDYSKNAGAEVTAAGDHRITTLGKLLRRTKLDELPELLNVASGEMALVGPRPEVLQYVDLESPAWRTLLSVRPGLTDETTLLLRNEERILQLGAARTGLDAESFYRHRLLPFKLRHANQALVRRGVLRDLLTIAATARAIVWSKQDVGGALQQILETVD